MTPDKQLALLKKALKIGGDLYRPEDIAAAVKAGTMQWWSGPAGTGHVVTSVSDFPTGVRVMNTVVMFGSYEDIMKQYDTVTEWARAQGCTRWFVVGRKGWLRRCPALGFKDTGHCTMVRDL